MKGKKKKKHTLMGEEGTEILEREEGREAILTLREGCVVMCCTVVFMEGRGREIRVGQIVVSEEERR